MKCTVCKGTGKITVEVENMTLDGMVKEPPMKMNCFDCSGTGVMTEAQLKKHKAYQNMWCKCKEGKYGVKYYSDGEHPKLHKHHYRCNHCGKVVQIG